MAAAHENLPHSIFYHYMVSNSEGGGEGWDYVDDLNDVCEAPTSPSSSTSTISKMKMEDINIANGIRNNVPAVIQIKRYYENKPMPILFHYCQHFKITNELSFYKGSHRISMMKCLTTTKISETEKNFNNNNNNTDIEKYTKIKFPLLECLPNSVGEKINYKQYKRGTDIYRSERKKKRGGFAVNIIHKELNEAYLYYQQRVCGGEGEGEGET